MIVLFIKYILGFIGFILLQVLILNHISLFDGWAQPYLYIYPLISLPLILPKRFLLLIGFAVGLTMDMFTHTPGIHTSASLALVFFRPTILKAIRPREGFKSYFPSIDTMGMSKYLTYSGLTVLIHHIWLFTLLYFSSGLIFTAIGHALLSSVFTLVLILIVQMFTQPDKTF
jgi:rod shape-determining protein MreD